MPFAILYTKLGFFNEMSEKISIIIPNFNSAATIKECLAAATSLDYDNYEVIVVDDASNDNSVDIIKRFPCRLISLKKNEGAAEARNVGAKNANGSILMFADSDIIIPENALKQAVEFMKKDNADIFFCSFRPKIRFRDFFSVYKHLYLCYYYEKQGEAMHTIDTSFAFIRKKIFDRLNGFNTQIRISEDVDLGVRLTAKGYKIHHAKGIQMEHIKHYSFMQFIKTDLVRSERMSRIFLSSLFGKRKSKQKSFYLRPFNIYAGIPLASLVMASAMLAAILKSSVFTAAAIALYALFIMVNLDFLNYLRKNKGLCFAIRASFINFLDMAVMNIGVLATLANFIIRRGNI